MTGVCHVGGHDDLFLFSSVLLSISIFTDSMVPSSKWLPKYLLFDSLLKLVIYYV